jgi:hypothetical protein
MAKRNTEKTVLGTFTPAVREEIKGVARSAEEIAKLREAGKVEHVLWVGSEANALKQLAQAVKPALELFAKSVLKATGEKNKYATVDRFVSHMMEAARSIDWQLPEKPATTKKVDGSISF